MRLMCLRNILYKAQRCQYSPHKLTKPLNRLIKKGYNYDTVVKSFKIAYFGVNIESLISLCVGTEHIYSKNSCWHDTGYVLLIYVMMV